MYVVYTTDFYFSEQTRGRFSCLFNLRQGDGSSVFLIKFIEFLKGDGRVLTENDIYREDTNEDGPVMISGMDDFEFIRVQFLREERCMICPGPKVRID